MRRRGSWFWLVVVAGLSVLGVLVYKSLAGFYESGRVSSASAVPIVGCYLEPLDANGPIDYVWHKMYIRRNSVILLCGKTSVEAFRSFFGASIRKCEEHNLASWTQIIQGLRADPCDFCIGKPDKGLFGHRCFWSPAEELIIRGILRVEDGCFTLYVVQIRGAGRKSD